MYKSLLNSITLSLLQQSPYNTQPEPVLRSRATTYCKKYEYFVSGYKVLMWPEISKIFIKNLLRYLRSKWGVYGPRRNLVFLRKHILTYIRFGKVESCRKKKQEFRVEKVFLVPSFPSSLVGKLYAKRYEFRSRTFIQNLQRSTLMFMSSLAGFVFH